MTSTPLHARAVAWLERHGWRLLDHDLAGFQRWHLRSPHLRPAYILVGERIHWSPDGTWAHSFDITASVGRMLAGKEAA